MVNEKKTECKYGAKCYRTGEEHLNKFSHRAKKEEITEEPSAKKAKTENSSETKVESSEKSAPSLEKPSVSETKETLEGISIPKTWESDEERNEFIKKYFLVSMPPDFFALWNLAKSINSNNPTEAFSAAAGVKLCGPYDVLSGDLSEKSSNLSTEDFLLHCRFPLDPPEFQTVLVGDEKHYGYLRDDPKDSKGWVVASNSNSLSEGTWTQISVLGDNLFALLGNIITEKLKKKVTKEAESLLKKLQKAADAEKYSMETSSAIVKERKKKCVAKSLHGGGVTVTMRGEVGYRELPESNANLKKLMSAIGNCTDDDIRRKKMEKIEEIITYIQFANDECDYGMGLEFGLDLFSSGYKVFHSEIEQLLSVAYMLLKRKEWGVILKAHLEKRWNRSLEEILHSE